MPDSTPPASVAAVLAPSVHHFRRGARWRDFTIAALDTDHIVSPAAARAVAGLPDAELESLGRRCRSVADIATETGLPEASFRRRPGCPRRRRHCRSSQRCARRSQMVRRLMAAGRQNQGMYLVFATLTVGPGHLSVFDKGSKDWQAHVRAMQRLDPGAQYAAVVERGAKNGRPHMHVMWWMSRKLWSCAALRTDLLGVPRQELWPHGLSDWRAVRTGRGDSWGRSGEHWPRRDDGSPVRQSDVERVARYVTKYMTGDGGEAWPIWRMRMSRNLGTEAWMSAFARRPQVALEVLADPWRARLRIPQRWRLSTENLRMLAARSLLRLQRKRLLSGSEWTTLSRWARIWKARLSPEGVSCSIGLALTRIRTWCTRVSSGPCDDPVVLGSDAELLDVFRASPHPIDAVWGDVSRELGG